MNNATRISRTRTFVAVLALTGAVLGSSGTSAAAAATSGFENMPPASR